MLCALGALGVLTVQISAQIALKETHDLFGVLLDVLVATEALGARRYDQRQRAGCGRGNRKADRPNALAVDIGALAQQRHRADKVTRLVDAKRHWPGRVALAMVAQIKQQRVEASLA